MGSGRIIPDFAEEKRGFGRILRYAEEYYKYRNFGLKIFPAFGGKGVIAGAMTSVLS